MIQRTCPHCGSRDLPATERTCPSCGQKVAYTAGHTDVATDEIIVAELAGAAAEKRGRRARGAIQSRSIGAILVILALLGIANSLLAMLNPPPQIAAPNPDPNIARAAQEGQTVARAAGTPVVLVLYLLMLAGAAAMITWQHWGLALAAAIIAMLPCSPGFLIGVPVGVWALVFLNLPSTKEGFKARRE